MHPVQTLFTQLKTKCQYPRGVIPVPFMLGRTAFFPGGAGLWGTDPQKPLPPFPVEKVMVLGNNFGSTDGNNGWKECVARDGDILEGPAWTNLISLWKKANIVLEKCFFTNAYMGLIEGEDQTATFPGANDPAYLKWARPFFIEQLKAQLPKLIIVLGVPARDFIAAMSNSLTSWRSCKNWKELDASSAGPVVTNVSFAQLPGWSTVVVALLHTCFRGPNLRYRSYHGATGDSAELAMLRDGGKLSGV